MEGFYFFFKLKQEFEEILWKKYFEFYFSEFNETEKKKWREIFFVIIFLMWNFSLLGYFTKTRHQVVHSWQERDATFNRQQKHNNQAEEEWLEPWLVCKCLCWDSAAFNVDFFFINTMQKWFLHGNEVRFVG